jgi:hypothetical protein
MPRVINCIEIKATVYTTGLEDGGHRKSICADIKKALAENKDVNFSFGIEAQTVARDFED